MQCSRAEMLATGFVDNELSLRDAHILFDHLGTCMKCRAYLHAIVRLQAGVRSFPVHQPPSVIRQKLLGSRALQTTNFSADRLPEQRTFWARRMSMTYASGAIALIFAILCSLALSLTFTRESPMDWYRLAPVSSIGRAPEVPTPGSQSHQF